MADAQTNPGNTQSQVPGDEGDKQKLFFGKYKTLEEAEAGFKEAERMAHSKAQEAAQWKELAEQANYTQGQNYGQAGQYVNPYQPPTSGPSDPAQILTRFYQDPYGVLREVKDVAKQELRDELTREQRRERDLSNRVSAWSRNNPDVAQHADMMDYWVKQTDGRLAPETRLDQAAAKVRERLVELRGKPQEANLNPNDYIPGPSGSREDSGQRAPQPAQPPTDLESQLKTYASSRNTSRMKRLGTHGR